jgi:hypothetical protein
VVDGSHYSKFRAILRDGEALSLDLERGQASSPLATFFTSLGETYQGTPLVVAVVGLDAAARADALGWLLGEPFRTVSSQIASAPGLREVRLSDSGFAIDAPDGQRQEFSSLPEFLAALQGDSAGPASVGLPSGGGHAAALLLVVESLEATALEPGLAATLIARSQLLLLSLGGRETLQADELERISVLAEGIGAVLPVRRTSGAQRWPTGLTEAFGRAVMLPGLQLGGDLAPPTPFMAPYEPLHAGLRLAHGVQRLGLAVTALADRQEGELKQAQNRKMREERQVRPDGTVSPDSPLRRPVEQARQRLAEDTAQLAKAVAESARRSLLSEGRLQRVIDTLLDSLRPEDLAQEEGTRMVRLSLTDGFQNDLHRALKQAFREELKQDLVLIRDGLEALRQHVEASLEQAGAPVTLALPPPSESEVWARISEMVSMEVRYRGEMPRRGFFQRLGEGRRAVFGVMMILSLVGSMVGFSWRGLGLIGVAFLLFFIGAVIYTYSRWKQEDAEKLTGEIDRVREQLNTECRRLATEVQRDKQQRIAEALEQCKRQVLTRLDDVLRERLQVEQAEQAEAREKAKLRLRKLDQQARELQQLGQRIARLRSEVSALEQDVQRGLRDAVRKLPVGAA